MGTMDGMIVPGYTRYILDKGQTSIARRNALKTYAQALSDQARKSQITDLDAFVSVATFAATSFIGNRQDQQGSFYRVYLEDLKLVLIGDGFTNSERNSGTYALRFQAFKDTGFKKKFQDGGNQVQHAMAGIYVSAVYGFWGRRLLEYQEDESVDSALYEAAFEIENQLDQHNFRSLPRLIKSILGG